jgi:hypothetical protein
LFFRIVFGFDAIIAAVILFFFFWGLTDGTALYAFGLWIGILAAMAIVLVGGYALHAQDQRVLANLLLLVLALPGFFYGAFVLLIIVLQPNWR